jgi:glucose-1-phosphate cytidylyltransferase
MKAVILAGGQGSRLSEETVSRPKPMVEIGGKPILWHIMKIYSAHGIQDFVICAGYRGYMIKEYFANYFMHTSDVTFRINENRMEVHHKTTEPWTITVVDTGETVMTGGRIARIKKYVEGETFCLTYGDGLADIPIPKLLAFHHEHGKDVTLTAVQSPGRFGALAIRDSKVESFLEKPKGDGAWINGGFFVCNPSVFRFLSGDATVWEQSPLQTLAKEGQLAAFHHHGFWQPMDTLRDKIHLEDLWAKNLPPWKTW